MKEKESKKRLVITIDGPAGAGKSTVAKRLAKRLGYLYVDTGAMYRGLTWKAIETGVNLEDPTALVKLAQETEILLKGDGGSLRTFVDGRDVSEEIRREEVTNKISYLADPPGVRARMVELQRELGAGGGVVVEGRDIGTVVFPEADAKFYLDASLEERGRRRFKELRARGERANPKSIARDISIRDEKDRSRPVGPLKVADGAIVIDTTNMTIDEEVETIACCLINKCY